MVFLSRGVFGDDASLASRGGGRGEHGTRDRRRDWGHRRRGEGSEKLFSFENPALSKAGRTASGRAVYLSR